MSDSRDEYSPSRGYRCACCSRWFRRGEVSQQNAGSGRHVWLCDDCWRTLRLEADRLAIPRHAIVRQRCAVEAGRAKK
jgi:hypothetical protein